MEVVQEFKEELHGLYSSKLPVSRAKIGTITKLAMKSIKFYKHIVMIVEKFVIKSAPPYKLPSLYVIDSIVRQSKHQYNEAKEVYGPRFGKKLDKIFPHILECSEADKPKVVRVLNLWLKNNVFPNDIIQPLLDLAPSTGSPLEQPSSSTQLIVPSNEEIKKEEENNKGLNDSNSGVGEQLDDLLLQQQDELQNLLKQSADTGQSEVLAALIDKAKKLQDLQSLQNQGSANMDICSPLEGTPKSDSNDKVPAVKKTGKDNKPQMSQSSLVANEFSKALLDNFDYSSDEDGDVSSERRPAPALSNDSNDASAIIDQLEEQFKREKEFAIANQQQSSSIVPPSLPPPPPPPPSHHSPPPPITHHTISPSHSPHSRDHHMRPPVPPSMPPPPHWLPHLPHPPHMGNWKNKNQGWPPFPPPPGLPPHPSNPHPPHPPSHHPHHSHPSHHHHSSSSSDRFSPPRSRFSPPPPRRRSPAPYDRFRDRSPIHYDRGRHRGRRDSRDFEERDFDGRGIRDIEGRGNRDFEGRDYGRRGNRNFDAEREYERRGSRDIDGRGSRDIDGRGSRDIDGRGSKGHGDRDMDERDYHGNRSRDRHSRDFESRERSYDDKSRDEYEGRGMEGRRHSNEHERSHDRRSTRSPSSHGKSGHVTVYSMTVWMGHLNKQLTEKQLSDKIAEYGKVKSVDFIIARGCAYVVMETREDAVKVVEELKDEKFLGQKCKIAWAPGRGAKGKKFEPYWEVSSGQSHVPHNIIKDINELKLLETGGQIDVKTLPPHLKEEVVVEEENKEEGPSDMVIG